MENDYINVTDQNGKEVYRIKECIDDFTYTFKAEDGTVKTFTVPEKRVVTFNYSLAKKQIEKLKNSKEKQKVYVPQKQKKTNMVNAQNMLILKAKTEVKQQLRSIRKRLMKKYMCTRASWSCA